MKLPTLTRLSVLSMLAAGALTIPALPASAAPQIAGVVPGVAAGADAAGSAVAPVTSRNYRRGWRPRARSRGYSYNRGYNRRYRGYGWSTRRYRGEPRFGTHAWWVYHNWFARPGF